MCDFRLSYGRVLSRSSKIIIVNRNRKEMLLNSDMFWKPQEAVQGELLGPPSFRPNTYRGTQSARDMGSQTDGCFWMNKQWGVRKREGQGMCM